MPVFAQVLEHAYSAARTALSRLTAALSRCSGAECVVSARVPGPIR